MAMKTGEKTIFVCDDDQEVLDSVSLLLQSAGYRVLTAHEHKEFMAKLQEATPDLVLLDVRMPERDGYWIAEGLQVLGTKIPIIFMTGYDSMIYRLYAPFVGAVQYFVKPIDPPKLLGKIDQLLKPATA